MSLFPFGKNTAVLGVDIGTSSIKIVEVTKKGEKTVVTNYGWVELPAKDKRQSIAEEVYQPDHIKRNLEALLSTMKPSTKSAATALPGLSSLVTLIELPKMSEQEINEAIPFEAQKYIPTSLDEVALSWEIIGKRESGADEGMMSGEKTQVLMVAAPKKEVERFEKIFDGLSIDVHSIEVETISLVHALVGNDTGQFIVIDIGARATSILLVENGTIKISRNIDVGGREISSTIADNMNISWDRAESLKKSEKNILSSRETAISLPSIVMTIAEVQRVSSAGMNEKRKEDMQVILSGGTARMVGLREYIETETGIKTIIGNPWARLHYEEKIAPYVEAIGPAFSVAIGLALKGVKDMEKK
ncbi:MAG: type IV pilus assembly protein PilM [Candidatus Moranbacteria bacterium]|nr:type IV pilus assembly protein PilM [Candidatus Moranbacteria bacterium]